MLPLLLFCNDANIRCALCFPYMHVKFGGYKIIVFVTVGFVLNKLMTETDTFEGKARIIIIYVRTSVIYVNC